MYLGYMKKGLQMMLMTAVSAYLAVFFGNSRIELIMAAFIIIIPVIWLYQMFDSMHTLSRLRRLGIEVPEDDGFFLPSSFKTLALFQNRTFAKVVAVLLLVFGVSYLVPTLLNNLHYFTSWATARDITRIVEDNIVPAIISITLIVLGIRLLAGGKNRKVSSENSERED
jgi:uncharacterized membrane protein